jgi:hypothetical protein
MIELDTPTQKYFKTHHLPFSMAVTDDDKILTNLEVQKRFYPMEDAYASLKLDGECTTIGRGYSHARSLDSKDHWSRRHIQQLARDLEKDISPGWRICGENMAAVHSIKYTNLESYFYVFSVWDENNVRLSLDDMIEYCDFTSLVMAPVLKRGPFRGFNFVNHLGLDFTKDEGYVVSNAKAFHFDEAKHNIAKVVRKGHVQTDDKHWFSKPQEWNELKK